MITLKIHVLYYVHYVHGAGAGASGTLLPSHRFLRGSWNRSHLLKAPQFLFCERCWGDWGMDRGGGDPAAAAKDKEVFDLPRGALLPLWGLTAVAWLVPGLPWPAGCVMMLGDCGTPTAPTSL